MISAHELGDFMRQKGFSLILSLIILALSIWLVVSISIDTFHGIDFYSQPRFLHDQFWICVVFMADYFLGLVLAKKKWHYFFTHLIFLIVSIPWQALIYKFGWHYGWTFSKEFAYLIRYMPLIRGGYAMAIVVSWLTSNKATGLFFSYIITLISTVYFASLTFFLFEKGVNPLIRNYSDALWWAAMDVTTVGSNIVAVTGVGRVLSVLLAALGMMMFPIFTVYVTNLITKHNSQTTDDSSLVQAFKDYMETHPLEHEQKQPEKKTTAPATSAAGTVDSSGSSGSNS